MVTRADRGGPVAPVTPTLPTNTAPLTPFNWNSGAGRPQMDIAAIMGAAMPLAGQAQLPTHTTPAPPFSGNFWDTVVSPDTMVSALNGLKKDSKSPLGVDITPLLNGTAGSGKTGTPAQSTGERGAAKPSTGGSANNALTMQMFLQSGMMDKIKNVFSPGGISPTSQGGVTPYY